MTVRRVQKFKIRYRSPEDGEIHEIERNFKSSPLEVSSSGLKVGPISAREWAEDLAYSLADKGWHEIIEIPI